MGIYKQIKRNKMHHANSNCMDLPHECLQNLCSAIIVNETNFRNNTKQNVRVVVIN